MKAPFPFKPTPVEEQLAEFANLELAKRLNIIHDSPPDNCDFCGTDFDSHNLFIDGKIKNQLLWANMCCECFIREGETIRWGRGQLYMQEAPDRWLLIGGFDPE